jgi:Ca-activated chloride channel family protein
MQEQKDGNPLGQLYWINENKTHQAIPLKHMHIGGKILDFSSELYLEYEFINNLDHSIESVFCFPVEAGTTVTGFIVETDGKIIQGKIEERDKAFINYDDEIGKGNTAYLLDWVSDDILYFSLGNLAPGQHVNIRINTVKALECRDDVIRMIIPLTVSPRYAPKNTDPLKRDRLSHEIMPDVPWRASLEIQVLSHGILNISSPSHTLNIRKNGEFNLIRIENDEIVPDRDILIDLKTKQSNGQCLISKHSNGDSAALIRFNPTFPESFKTDSQDLELYFVLDCSGSMGGFSIKSAKETLELCLRQLSQNDVYNIYCFGSDYKKLNSALLANNKENFEKTLENIRNQEADMGGTELLSPLSDIVNSPTDPGKQKAIIIITDGQVMNDIEIRDLFLENEQNIQVFTFAIGFGAAHGLLKDLSNMTRAAYESIHPEEHSAPAVLRQFSRLVHPQVRDIKLQFDSTDKPIDITNTSFFEGDVWLKLLSIPSDKKYENVTISGICSGKKVEWTLPVHDLGIDNLIPVLWADQSVKSKESHVLQNELVQAKGRKRDQPDYHLKLALKFSLLTDRTSFVGIQKRKTGDKLNSNPEYVRIPVQLTYGWGGFPKINQNFSLKNEHHFKKDVGYASAVFFNKRKFSKMDCITENYIEILKTQEIEGYFSDVKTLLPYAFFAIKEIKKIDTFLINCPEPLKTHITATLYALILAEKDKEFARMALAAIQKARKWLKKVCREEGLDYNLLEKMIKNKTV